MGEPKERATDSQARITLFKPEFPILYDLGRLQTSPLWFLDSCQLLAASSQFPVLGSQWRAALS